MSIFSNIKKLAGFKSATAGNKKTYSMEDLLHLIANSRDKEEIKIAVATYLAIAKVSLENGKEENAKTLIVGIMGLVNNRKDDVFNLEDVWGMIVNGGLKDAANKMLGTQL
ncbi:MAG: hypothetical protein LBL07_11230 [Tannerella sp.]|jgi:hypothetical protein|nr:hypothetical protein [Tannerella sp.]